VKKRCHDDGWDAGIDVSASTQWITTIAAHDMSKGQKARALESLRSPQPEIWEECDIHPVNPLQINNFQKVVDKGHGFWRYKLCPKRLFDRSSLLTWLEPS
jgi:hypothetical protein